MKSDSAQELVEAVKQLDWLPEPGLRNDPYHNAKLESNIRRIKEGTRAIHLAAGFSHKMWPRSIEYFFALPKVLPPKHQFTSMTRMKSKT